MKRPHPLSLADRDRAEDIREELQRRMVDGVTPPESGVFPAMPEEILRVMEGCLRLTDQFFERAPHEPYISR